MIEIRKAIDADKEDVWKIIQQVISGGDTYVFAPDSPKEKMLSFWFGRDRHTYVATSEGKIVGTFLLKDNQPDLGSHIANGAYMTAPNAGGKGIGKLMGEYSIQEAKRLGYQAIQFNIVVKSNTRAVRLWQKIGFEIIGEIPDAFNHRQLGMTNAYIMYRTVQ
jgi:ribosomal protein S18 acetylase RimI-like enzyme